MRFVIPVDGLGFPSVLDVCSKIRELPVDDEHEIDVSNLQHIEPFSLLLLGSAIRSVKHRVSGIDMNVQGHQFAAHLGFWQSIGISVSTAGRSTQKTIPISTLEYHKLYRQSGGRDPIRSQAVQLAAINCATVLSSGEERLQTDLAYCFREAFRNVFEHSGANEVWYCGTTRPTKDTIQLAWLDEGKGIREALAECPSYRVAKDEEALSLAIRPGVSGKADKPRSEEMRQKLREDFPESNPEEWDNSGYGLAMISNIAREAGQFAIVSGNACLAFVGGNAEVRSTAKHAGTAIRLTLHISRLPGAIDRALSRASQEDVNGRTGRIFSASMQLRMGINTTGGARTRP